MNLNPGDLVVMMTGRNKRTCWCFGKVEGPLAFEPFKAKSSIGSWEMDLYNAPPLVVKWFSDRWRFDNYRWTTRNLEKLSYEA